MNEVIKYAAKYNKQIAEFDPNLAKELKAGIHMESDSALVILDQEKVVIAGYLTYGGKFQGKKGDRHDYDLHTAWSDDAKEEDYAHLLVIYRHMVRDIAQKKSQLAEVRIFVDMTNVEFLDKLCQTWYGFGDTLLEMKRGGHRTGNELNPKCEEAGYDVNVCSGEEEFEEYMEFYGREDLRESIQNKIILGGQIYLGRLNGKIVSAAIACPREDVEISDLYTAEDFRENYYAHDLLARLIKDYRAKRKKTFTFRVKANNYGAIQLCQAISFRLSKMVAETYCLAECE